MAYMAKTLAVIFGVILVLLGLLGFVSNPLVGAGAVFLADTMHNVIRIVLGAILLVVAVWSPAGCARWLKVVGTIVFLLGLIGLFTVPSAGGMLLGIAETNGASNWLHLVAGLVIFIAGMYSNGDEPRMPSPGATQM